MAHGRRREIQDYWRSYSDIMAALLLMFILIMSASMYRSSKAFQEKDRRLEEQKALVTEKEKQIQTQTREIQSQTEDLRDKKRQLSDLTRSLGIKREIIEKLHDAFVDSGMQVQLDHKTGSITFSSSILFKFDSDKLTEDGKKFLNSFAPKYSAVLLNEHFQAHISEIIVEGHADPQGDFLYNLSLSQSRALAVASFFLDDKSPLKKEQIMELRKILTANGRSSSIPLYRPDGRSIDYAASRRVVFLFRLKDEQMIEDIQRILENK